MPILYTATKDNRLAFVLDPGQQGVTNIGQCRSYIEAELIAVQYGLNSYFIAWQKELDSRHEDFSEGEWGVVSTPSDRTKRQLPDAVEIRLSSWLAYKDLARGESIIPSFDKLIKNIQRMLRGISYKISFIEVKENKARRLLS